MGAATTAVGGIIAAAGDRQKEKAARRNMLYQRGQVDRGYDYADAQLNELFGENGSIGNLYGQAKDYLSTGADEAGGILAQGYGQAGQTAQTGMREAIGMLDQYSQQGGQAFDLYNQALMGGEGAQAAFDTFRQGTGYQFLQDEMQQATQRQMGAAGMNKSGNVLAELQNRSAGLASQSFNDYMSQLMGSAQMGMGAAGQQAGMQSSLTQYLSGLDTGLAENQANIRSGLGSALAQLGVSEAALEGQLRGTAMQGGYGLANTALGGAAAAGQAVVDTKGEWLGTLGGSMAVSGNQAWGDVSDIAGMFGGFMGG